MPELKIGAEICEDIWSPMPPSISHALAGANVIVNLSASDETTGKDVYRRDLVKGQSLIKFIVKGNMALWHNP